MCMLSFLFLNTPGLWGIRSLLYMNNECLGHMVSDISYISSLIWKCGYCVECAIVVVIVTIFYCGQIIISCE